MSQNIIWFIINNPYFIIYLLLWIIYISAILLKIIRGSTMAMIWLYSWHWVYLTIRSVIIFGFNIKIMLINFFQFMIFLAYVLLNVKYTTLIQEINTSKNEYQKFKKDAETFYTKNFKDNWNSSIDILNRYLIYCYIGLCYLTVPLYISSLVYFEHPFYIF